MSAVRRAVPVKFGAARRTTVHYCHAPIRGRSPIPTRTVWPESAVANPSGDKGTRAETAAARWLTDETGDDFRRHPKHGSHDRGDVYAQVHPWLAVEIKNTKVPNLRGWQRELAAECRNAGATHGVVLWSPPGVGLSDPGRWIALEWCADRPPIHWLRAMVPHVGPLNRFHRFVAAVDDWGVVVTDNAGGTPAWSDTDSCVRAQLASWWMVGLREHITKTRLDASQPSA